MAPFSSLGKFVFIVAHILAQFHNPLDIRLDVNKFKKTNTDQAGMQVQVVLDLQLVA